MKNRNTVIYIMLTIIVLGNIALLVGNFFLYRKISNLEIANKQIAENLELYSSFTKENIENQKNQFEKTVQIAKTYDNILEEQKKQNSESSVKNQNDNPVQLSMIEEAERYYEHKEWKKAYKEYQRLVAANQDNYEFRYRKALCLYKANPLDSSKYKEIISDCNFLRNNSYPLKELEEIENSINREKSL